MPGALAVDETQPEEALVAAVADTAGLDVPDVQDAQHVPLLCVDACLEVPVLLTLPAQCWCGFVAQREVPRT